jgi:hypothetical protein
MAGPTKEQGELIGIGIIGLGGVLVGKLMIDNLAESRRRAKSAPKPSPASKQEPIKVGDVGRFVSAVFAVFVIVRDAPLLIDAIKELQRLEASVNQ